MSSPLRVAVLIAALNEERTIEKTLQTLRSQDTEMRLILVDSASKDHTVEVAGPYVDEIIQAPTGKLNATDYAIRTLAHEYDVVATCDADTYYPTHWLRALLAAMAPGVVLTYGPFRMPGLEGNPIAGIGSAAINAMYGAGGAVPGMNKAFLVDAYLACGGFNLNALQKSWAATWVAEEVNFRHDMQRMGLTRFVPDAWCITSPRRMMRNVDPEHARQVAQGEKFG
jgi:glycosyltransferase involved in cell wall biosynthesis